MRNLLLAAVAALPFASVPCFAGEGNGAPFSLTATGDMSARVPQIDTGAEAAPEFNGLAATVQQAVLAATGNSEGMLHSANSLPPRF